MCSTLAHIPVGDIDEGWIIIMSNSPDNDQLRLFFDYFIEQWLENPIILRRTWNCHKKIHRTNNIVKGWISKLNKILNTPRSTFKNLYNCLKKEAENSELLYARSYLNMEGKRRKKNAYTIKRKN